MPRDPPVTKQDLPVRSAMLNLLDPDETERGWPAGRQPPSWVVGRVSALGGFGRLDRHLGGGLPALEGRLLGSLDDLGELRYGLSIALEAEVKQAQAGIDRGVLGIERALDGQLRLRAPRGHQVTAHRVRVIEERTRNLERGFRSLGAIAGRLGGDPGSFGDG